MNFFTNITYLGFLILLLCVNSAAIWGFAHMCKDSTIPLTAAILLGALCVGFTCVCVGFVGIIIKTK